MQDTTKVHRIVLDVLRKHRLNHDNFICACGDWKHHPLSDGVDPVTVHTAHLTAAIVVALEAGESA
jgi:CDGSH-type Zn-finger protein